MSWVKEFKKEYEAVERLFQGKTNRIKVEYLFYYIFNFYNSCDPGAKSGNGDREKRKWECVKQSGLPSNQKSPDAVFVRALVDLEREPVSFFVVEYCKAQNNRLWTMIVSNEHTFSEYQKLLLTPITEAGNDLLKGAEIKGKLMREMEIIHNRLTAYYKEMFPDEVALQLKRKPVSESITPEKIAAMADENKD